MPRTFHHGIRGTFMDPRLHRQYFERIAHNTDPSVRWLAADFPRLRELAISENYERRLRARIAAATPLADFGELLGGAVVGATVAAGGEGGEGGGGSEGMGARAVWYDQHPRDGSSTVFKELARAFGLWHEMRRAQHLGVHELWCRGRPLFLINLRHGHDAHDSPYSDLAPQPEAKRPPIDGPEAKRPRHDETEAKRPPAILRTGAQVAKLVKAALEASIEMGSSLGAVPGAGESQRALKLCVAEPVDAIPVRAAAQSASHNARLRAHLRKRRHA